MTKIAGKQSTNSWSRLKKEIDNDPQDMTIWEKVFDTIYMERLNSRYLEPIACIEQNLGKYSGEGFAIVAIQCSLIEFLETSITGETYKYKNPVISIFEYNDSKNKFVNFLSTRFPFNKKFDKTLATDFYESVRCGVLHEAQTKNGWLIRVDNSNEIVEVRPGGEIVFDRKKFAKSLDIFFKDYRKKLLTDSHLQHALRRKLNVVCGQSILS